MGKENMEKKLQEEELNWLAILVDIWRVEMEVQKFQ